MHYIHSHIHCSYKAHIETCYTMENLPLSFLHLALLPPNPHLVDPWFWKKNFMTVIVHFNFPPKVHGSISRDFNE